MRILYVTNMYPYMLPHLPYAGIFVKEQIEAVQKQSSDITIDVYIINGAKSRLCYLYSIWGIYQRIKKFKPDVIHIHYGLSGLFLLFFPSFKHKTVITLHGGDIMPQQKKWVQIWLTKKILKKVAKVIILNQQMEQTLLREGINGEIVKCGVDTDFFECSGVEASKHFKTIIFPADPKRNVKNFPLFEKTLEIVKRSYSCPINIITFQNMDRQQIRKAMCSADCMILTSFSEGSPQVIKEALSCNLPIVSVDVGDVGEILQNVAGSHIVCEYNPEKLAEAALNVLSKPKNQNGRNRLMALELDNHLLANKLLKLYRAVQ